MQGDDELVYSFHAGFQVLVGDVRLEDVDKFVLAEPGINCRSSLVFFLFRHVRYPYETIFKTIIPYG